jgi:integrase
MAKGEDEDLPWRIKGGKYWKPRRAPDPLREPPACGTVAEAELLIHAALEEDRARRSGAHGVAYARRLCDLGPRCTIALFLGLRNGELAGLGWDDLVLDGDRPQARICHQAIDQWRKHHPTWKRPLTPPKGKRERRLLLHPTAVVAFVHQRELLEERRWYRADGPVFPGHEGNAFAGTWRNNANGIRPDHMKRLAKTAGLPFPEEWVTHSLRHSLATVESTSGADLRSIQKRTGHGSLRVLEGYIHARTGRALAPSAIPQLALSFDTAEHDTDRDLTTVPEREE